MAMATVVRPPPKANRVVPVVHLLLKSACAVKKISIGKSTNGMKMISTANICKQRPRFRGRYIDILPKHRIIFRKSKFIKNDFKDMDEVYFMLKLAIFLRFLYTVKIRQME